MATRKTEQRRNEALAGDSLKELSSLATSAEYLVKMIGRYSEELKKKKLTTDGRAINAADRELDELNSILSDIGLASLPSKDASTYHEDLCKVIAESVEKVFQVMESKMILLSDLYCLVNRARVTNLISPKDVFSACALLSRDDSQRAHSMTGKYNLVFKRFPTGVAVLMSGEYNDDVIAERIQELVQKKQPVTVTGIADSLSLSYGIANVQVTLTESLGLLCRDETDTDTYFYVNRFV